MNNMFIVGSNQLNTYLIGIDPGKLMAQIESRFNFRLFLIFADATLVCVKLLSDLIRTTQKFLSVHICGNLSEYMQKFLNAFYLMSMITLL